MNAPAVPGPVTDRTIGVLLMAYGGPDSLPEVPGYLADIRHGRPTPRRVVQEITEHYRRIGGSSPLRRHSARQRDALEARLESRRFRCYLGMRHWSPWIEEVVASMAQDGIQRAIGVVLAPHYSSMNTERYFQRVREGLELYQAAMDVQFVRGYHESPPLIQALAARVAEGLERWPIVERDGVHVVFCAHSLPARVIAEGDPYDGQLRQTARLVAARAGLADDRWSWSYLSAGRSPEPWLGPSLSEHLEELRARRIQAVVCVPVGFVADHVEVLYDIDIEAQEKARELGIRLERPPSLGDDPLFIEALALAVEESAQRGRLLVKRLVIVGGGISGLAAAWTAVKAGIDVTLIEREQRLGGKLRTDRVEGFLLEAGPDSFLSRKPAAAQLCEALGISSRLQPRRPQPRRTFVQHQHRLHPMPEGFSGLIPTDLEALKGCDFLSAEARERALREPEIPPRVSDGDESVESFMTRRFGAETFQLLIEPLVSGIYAADAGLLSLESTYPHLREIELRHGNLTRGLAPAPARAVATDAFLSLPEGMGELVTHLEGHLDGARILRGVRAHRVSRLEGRFRVETDSGSIAADALILAAPAHEAAPLVGPMDQELSALLAAIPSASPAIVHLGYPASSIQQALDGYGYVIPRVEGSPFIACTWTSSKWEGRAPDGMVLLRLYAGRAGAPAPGSDEPLVEAAREELSATLGIRARPVLSKVHRWELGMPQYTLGHPRKRLAIRARLETNPGLYLAGASSRGVGIPDCIESGQEAARSVIGRLER